MSKPKNITFEDLGLDAEDAELFARGSQHLFSEPEEKQEPKAEGGLDLKNFEPEKSSK